VENFCSVKSSENKAAAFPNFEVKANQKSYDIYEKSEHKTKETKA